MTVELHIGDGLTLPPDVLTEAFAILAKRGSGKTYTAMVMVEQMVGAGLPVAVIDPTGAWWGLRSSADGRSPGLPFVIFGGDHADVPLEETAGHLLADLLVDERLLAVLDLSHFSKSASRRFMADFLERLYHRNREPLHLVIDEADLFAPQTVQQGAQRLLGAMEDLVRRGRLHGLGVTLITQRPAVIHKDVLSQVEILIVMRLTGVRDVNAIDDWVSLHADHEQAAEIKRSLPSLPIGTAWFWSPGLGIVERVKVTGRTTFDSSATPKVGQRRIEPKRFADVDLEALGERITATVERAKADDPKTLKARIAQLEKQAAHKPDPEIIRVEIPVLAEDLVIRLEGVLGDLKKHGQQAVDVATEMLASLQAAQGQQQPVPQPVRAAEPAARVAPAARTVAASPAPSGNLPISQRKILTVLAQHGTRTTTQVALLTGYSHKSGGYRNSLSSLRSAGHIEGRGDVAITDDGLLALGEYEPLPTGRDLLDWWSRQLGKAERVILHCLVDQWPAAVSTEQLAQWTGYSPTSGGFRNALSRLRSLELASGRGELRAADELGRP